MYGRQDDAVSLVKAIIDAERGDKRRYHEANESFRTLTETIGRPTVATASTSNPASKTVRRVLQFEGSVGHATGRSLAEDGEFVRHAIRFTDSAADRVDTVREVVSDQRDFTAIEVFAEGKTVLVDGKRTPSN